MANDIENKDKSKLDESDQYNVCVTNSDSHEIVGNINR